MARDPGTGKHSVSLLLPLLCLMAAAPVGAQQVSAFARKPTGTALTPPARSSTAGPRLTSEWHPAAPAYRPEAVEPSSSDNHTITLSTIALVLVVVVLVLLIVR